MDVLTYILAAEGTRVAAFVVGFAIAVVVGSMLARVVLR